MSIMRDVLQRHTTLFNQGVRTGDFGPMLAYFHDDADFTIQGLPIGPFIGKAAIATSYASQPPSDEIVLLGVHEDSDRIGAIYAWRGEPTVRAGEMVLILQGETIRHLWVIYGSGE